MKHTIRFTLAALAAAAAVLATSAPAYADYDFGKVADPHIPIPEIGWCIGGSAGNISAHRLGYCDGAHYPDGSFWHIMAVGQPAGFGVRSAPPGYGVTASRMYCVIDNGGNPNPPPAPPGGCGGAALGDHHAYIDSNLNMADYDFGKVADPHIPVVEMFWCRGGSMPACDGEHYPDGSFWHVLSDFGWVRHIDCVIDNGTPLPPLAPPGGCGGAVK